MKAADCVFRRNGASVHAGSDSAPTMPTSDKLVPSGSVKDKTAKTLFQRLMRNAFLDEPVRPVSNRAYGNAKRYLLRKTHARTSWRRVLPRKKGENGARMANPIAIVEVIVPGSSKFTVFLTNRRPMTCRRTQGYVWRYRKLPSRDGCLTWRGPLICQSSTRPESKAMRGIS